MPRSLVGKLLAKVRGGGTPPVPTPTTTAPKGPKDPGKAMLLYTRLRDAGLEATRQNLVLGGQLEARRKAIVTELEADRYDQAERLLDAHDNDLKDEVKQQQRATQRLKDEFAELKKQAVLLAAQVKSTSPAMAKALKAVTDAEAAVLDLVKAKSVIAAANAMAPYDEAIKAVSVLARQEKEACDKALLKLATTLQGLTAPVIGPEVAQVKTTWLVQAKGQSDGGDPHAGLALALKGQKACEDAVLLQKAYELALSTAESLLQSKLAQMYQLDAEKIQAELIDAAKVKAKAGQRQAALDLLAQVATRCTQAKGVKDASPFNTTTTTELANDMKTLLAHAQRAAFKTEITALSQRYERAKANQSANLGKAAVAMLSEIYWECKRLIGQADVHGTYMTRRDDTVAPLVAALRSSGPVETVKALSAQIKDIEDQLARAHNKALKHLYELANQALDEVTTACADMAKLKLAHVAYAKARQEAADALKALPDLTGTPLAPQAQALTDRLAKATEQGLAREFAVATPALVQLKVELLALQQMSDARLEAAKAGAAAVATSGPVNDSAVRASLDKVKQLLATLKQHEGHEGAKPQILQMEGLLKQAEEALKA